MQQLSQLQRVETAGGGGGGIQLKAYIQKYSARRKKEW